MRRDFKQIINDVNVNGILKKINKIKILYYKIAY